jgi:drug/metabolite transporter (DMT)-like permease
VLVAEREAGRRPVALAAAACLGINLYVSGLIGQALPLAWAALPARLTGVVVIALPLILLHRLGLTRTAAPFVVVTGVSEVIGIAAFAFGAHEGIAIASVIASQFAAIAAVAAIALLGERLTRIQIAGVAMITVCVAVLAAIRRMTGPPRRHGGGAVKGRPATLPRRDHPAGSTPQLLDHRPHRPWEVDPR